VLSYLDTRHDGGRLLPMDGSDGWRTLADTGRAIAFLDGISVWNRELRFGLKAPGVIAIETTRAEAGRPMRSNAPSARAIIRAAKWIDRRGSKSCSARRSKTRAPPQVWVWRPGRPLLSAFLDEIARRPSFAATVQPEIEL